MPETYVFHRGPREAAEVAVETAQYAGDGRAFIDWFEEEFGSPLLEWEYLVLSAMTTSVSKLAPAREGDRDRPVVG
jgi:hypothetical protein